MNNPKVSISLYLYIIRSNLTSQEMFLLEFLLFNKTCVERQWTYVILNSSNVRLFRKQQQMPS